MPKISAMIHTANDAQQIARALESLHVCDEVLVIDHGSCDDTAKIAQDHGAKVKSAVLGVEYGTYVVDAGHDWILCLLPCEAVSEPLQASLSEWKNGEPGSSLGFAVGIRQQTANGPKTCPPEVRLANRKKINWTGALPPNYTRVPRLHGDLLQFRK